LRRMPGSVYTLPVPAILYLSAIKYKNDPRSLAIKAIKGAIEPVGCRDFCTAIYCKMMSLYFHFSRNYPFG